MGPFAAVRPLAGSKYVSTQRFAVEFDRRTVGIAVRVPGGFLFFSSSSLFDELDGRLFPRARAIEHQLRKTAHEHASRAAAHQRPLPA
jgi:hypothetical protein